MSKWCCPNCGTDTVYFYPDNPTAKSCFCTFTGEIIDDEHDRIINILNSEIERVSNPMLVDREYLDGLEEAITLIKGDDNE